MQTDTLSAVFSFDFFKKFFDSIKSGVHEPYTADDITEIVESYYFSEPSLLPLSEEEEVNLRKVLTKTYEELFFSSQNALLAKDDFFFAKEIIEHIDTAPLLVHVPNVLKEDRAVLEKANVPLVTSEEKIAIFEDPSVYRKISIRDGNLTSAGISGMGYRFLNEYPYNFEHLITITKISTGKEEGITVLDLGGGIGLALKDLKEQHPEVYTINYTMDVEPCMYTADRTILGAAERFPSELAETVDLVVSNMAFRYFYYPDLAVKNVVHSLSVGGIAHIFVTTERSDNANEEELKDRLTETYFWLKDLKEKEVISITYGDGGPFGEPLRVEETLYPCRMLYITKLKSVL